MRLGDLRSTGDRTKICIPEMLPLERSEALGCPPRCVAVPSARDVCALTGG